MWGYMKSKQPSLSEEIERMDTTTDWGKVADIVDARDRYKLEIIDELLSKISDLNEGLYNTKIKDEISLQQIPEGPQAESVKMEMDIKDKFLKELESKNLIQNLKIATKEIVSDAEMPIDIINASFSYTPSVVKEKLEVLKDRLMQNERNRAVGSKTKATYITQDGEDYYYKGVLIEVGTDAIYRKVFDVLFDVLPDGGYVPYGRLAMEIRKRFPEKNKLSDSEMQEDIRENLLDHNGFLHHAKIGGVKIPTTIRGGKRLINIRRGKGVEFNNHIGA